MNPERSGPERPQETMATVQRRLDDLHQRKLVVLQRLADKLEERELKETRQDIEQHD